MSLFKVGEIAILRGLDSTTQYEGQEVEITQVGPFMKGQIVTAGGRTCPCFEDTDYFIKTSDGGSWTCREKYLRKRRPPEERGSWVDVYAITGWMPLEQARTKVCQKN